MNPVNPFTYGNPISDPHRFVGRAREIEQIFSRLRNVEFESSSLVGERRIGKTSLLNYLADPGVRRAHGLNPDEYIFVYADLALLDATTTPPRLWQYLLRQIAPHLSPDDSELLEAVIAQAPALDNFALAEVFDRLDVQKRHVVLLLDEFENVTRNNNFGPDFFYGLRSLAIHHHPALITSSRRELIELTHSEEIRSSPFFNIFANINVRLLTGTDAHSLIQSALSDRVVRFTPPEIETLIRLAGTHPFFLQTAAHFLYQTHVQELNSAERDRVWQDQYRAEATPHLHEYWRQCEPREKIVLGACALLAMAPPRRGAADFSETHLRQILGRSERILAQLEKRALVISNAKTLTPFNQLFTEWILGGLDEAQIPGAEGQEITLRQAIREHKSTPVDSATLPGGLTPREIQVLRLVATGMSDVQVAAKLVVSPRTVSTHLQSIYNKIGVNSRAAAARFAHEHNLV
jgi:DNA-binding CsgD family transcriptional regulator